MSEERGLLLLSGGIDSPVAGHMVQRMGYDLDAVHFSLDVFTGEEPLEKSREIAGELGMELYEIDANEELARIAKEGEHKLYYVLQRRFMLKVGEEVAEREGYDFLVTGDNIGQVSSQTIFNLRVIDEAVDLPVLRPLLTMEKEEIVEKAKEIETFGVSVGPEHCDALGPDHPRTRADMDWVAEIEEEIGMDELVGACAGSG